MSYIEEVLTEIPNHIQALRQWDIPTWLEKTGTKKDLNASEVLALVLGTTSHLYINFYSALDDVRVVGVKSRDNVRSLEILRDGLIPQLRSIYTEMVALSLHDQR